jgi:hypothetical protein
MEMQRSCCTRELDPNCFWLVRGVLRWMDMQWSFGMCELDSNFLLVHFVFRRMEMQR